MDYEKLLRMKEQLKEQRKNLPKEALDMPEQYWVEQAIII